MTTELPLPDNLTKLAYRCKMCGCERVASYNATCPIKNIEAWRSMLTCTRCYAFCDDFKRVGNAIGKFAYKLILSRQTPGNDVEKDVRPAIDQLTKKLCSLVCNHYRVTNVWDQSFVDQIIEKPERAWQFIHFYRRGVEQISKQAHA